MHHLSYTMNVWFGNEGGGGMQGKVYWLLLAPEDFDEHEHAYVNWSRSMIGCLGLSDVYVYRITYGYRKCMAGITWF